MPLETDTGRRIMGQQDVYAAGFAKTLDLVPRVMPLGITPKPVIAAQVVRGTITTADAAYPNANRDRIRNAPSW
jgi:hypothetical protein